MSRYHLNIVRWSALSATRAQQGDWLAWAQEVQPDELDAPVKPDLPQVPAMLRRRLTAMGKRALWCAYQVLDTDVRPMATVFSSQHGEVEQTLKLLTDLAADQPLSPTGFSLSVHNAIGGIYSMAGRETGPITALSAGADSVCAALLEAYCLLHSRDGSGEVLCVTYDDPVPALLSPENAAAGEVQALALVVSVDPVTGGIPLEFSLTGNDQQLVSGAVCDHFLRFLLNDQEHELKLGVDQRLWHWQKQGRAQAS